MNQTTEQEVQDHLTPTERGILGTLRKTLDSAQAGTQHPPWRTAFLTDACLCRFLRARNWDVTKAFNMLQETLAWRSEFRPDAISWDQVQSEAASGKMYVAAEPDRLGRRVLVMRPANENSKDHDNQIKFLVYCLETALRRKTMDNVARGAGVDLSAEQICLVIDYKGWSMFNAPPMKTSKETLAIFQNHYPERLGAAICYNPPTIFRAFWGMISPFIDPKTYTKIHFLGPRDSNHDQVLGSMFHLDKLEAALGGTSAVTFDFLEYEARMREEEKMFNPVQH